MFARRVVMALKPSAVEEFTQKFEDQVLPLLRKQEGFQDELVCISSDGTKAFGLSLWDQKANAEAYVRNTYPEVEKILSDVIEGAPRIYTYTVANSTFHKIAASASA